MAFAAVYGNVPVNRSNSGLLVEGTVLTTI